MPHPVTLKSLDASATLGSWVGQAAGCAQLPHLDRLIKTAADKISSIGRKRNTIHAVFVPVWALKTLQQVALVNVPNADALIERASRHVLGVGGDGDSGDAILNCKGQSIGALLNVPETNGSVSGAGCNRTPIASKVQRVNILFVAREGVANLAGIDVPNLQSIELDLKHQSG